MKDIKAQFSSYGKEEKAFNFDSKLTLEKLLHIESASLCPSSLNTVFIPQALSLLLREPHCLSPMSLSLWRIEMVEAQLEGTWFLGFVPTQKS
jgi:hypothetical protein